MYIIELWSLIVYSWLIHLSFLNSGWIVRHWLCSWLWVSVPRSFKGNCSTFSMQQHFFNTLLIQHRHTMLWQLV